MLHEPLEKAKQQWEKPDQWLPETDGERGKTITKEKGGCGHDLCSVYVAVMCQPQNGTVKTSLSGDYISRKLLFSKTTPGFKKFFSHV